MPGKKKGGKKKGGKGAKKVEPELTPEQEEHRGLVEEAERLKKLLKEESEDINVFQQQRSQLNYFWIVEKKKLEDRRADLRNKEREVQDLEEKHQVEIKVYKQRVKHLLFEQQDELTHLKTANETTRKMLQDEQRDAKSELKTDKRALKVTKKEKEVSHEEFVNALKREQDRKISELRQEFERKARDMQLWYDDLIKRTHKRLEEERKEETARVERRKDRYIAELMRSHEKAFSEVKGYFNDITHNNLDRIKSLKEDVERKKGEEAADEKRMVEIALENKRMSEPLKQALEDVRRLREKLRVYEEEKEQLRSTKAELRVEEDKLQQIQWEHEVLQQRYERVASEKEELESRFQKTVYAAQQRAGFKNVLLERKLSAAQEAVERKDAQLNEVLAQANLDTAVLGDVTSRLEDVVEAKNQQVRELQGELDKAVQRHTRTVQKFESKLGEYGVPSDELGFQVQLHGPREEEDGAGEEQRTGTAAVSTAGGGRSTSKAAGSTRGDLTQVPQVGPAP